MADADPEVHRAKVPGPCEVEGNERRMFFIIGFVVVFGSVLGGYMPHGDIGVLMQQPSAER